MAFERLGPVWRYDMRPTSTQKPDGLHRECRPERVQRILGIVMGKSLHADRAGIAHGLSVVRVFGTKGGLN